VRGGGRGVLADDWGAIAAPLETSADERGGWARVYDPKTERFYYHEMATDRVQWDAPGPWASDTVRANATVTATTTTAAAAASSASSATTIAPNRSSASPAVAAAAAAASGPPLTALAPTDDSHLCGTDFGLSALSQNIAKRFPPSAAAAAAPAIWLRIVIVSHGLPPKDASGKTATHGRTVEDVLRLVRAMMMDIAATSNSAHHLTAVDVMVANLAGDSRHGAGMHNPGFESARLEAGRLQTDHFKSVLRFFDAGFNMVGACGQSARRDFDAALAIARAAGPAKYSLLLEPGQTLCPSAMLLLFYAVQKSQDYDPDWSSLRIGVGLHGYGGLLLRDASVQQIVERTSDSATAVAKFFGVSRGDASMAYLDDARFMTDLLGWQRALRQDSAEVPSSAATTASIKSANRPMGGSFTYRFALVANNFAGVGCGKAIELAADFKDLQFASDGRCRENDLSPCLASEEDAWLDYRPSHVHAVIPSSIALTIAAPGQSCTQACGALAPPVHSARPYTCVPASHAGRHFSDCSTLRGRFPCPGGCVAINTAEAIFPTPSAVVAAHIDVSGVPVERGMCLMSMSGGMAPCARASKEVSRLCPCSHEEQYQSGDAAAGSGSGGGGGGGAMAAAAAADASGNAIPAGPNEAVVMEIVRGYLGASCEATCATKGMRCFGPALRAVNNCEAMKKAFGCAGGCEQNEGGDQPAFEPSSHRCLTKRDDGHFDCRGTFPSTQRLCHCAK
jgi:hypothetical protein